MEITRCCVDSGRNVCSMIYSTLCRAARALGYRKAITYTLASESGASLKAAGFRAVAKVRGHSWNHPARPREDKAPLVDKVRWERVL